MRRSSGALDLSVRRDDSGTTRLAGLGQSGCLKLRFPRIVAGAALEAVMVNISGGVVAGDRLDAAFCCGPRAALCVTSQAAERYYRARSDDLPADVQTRLSVGARGRLDWLPQEAILFDGVRLRRSLDIAMASDSVMLAVESQVFGRHGHGERLRTLSLRDRIRIVRDGRLVFDNPVRWDGEIADALERPALLAGAAAAATIVLAAPDAAQGLAAVRAVLADLAHEDVTAAASSWNGLLVTRILSRHDGRHRVLVARVLQTLRGGTPLPRVWQM